MVEGKIDAPRPHTQLQLGNFFMGPRFILSYLGTYLGALAPELVPGRLVNFMQMALKSPQGYNRLEVESQVVRPVGK